MPARAGDAAAKSRIGKRIATCTHRIFLVMTPSPVDWLNHAVPTALVGERCWRLGCDTSCSFAVPVGEAAPAAQHYSCAATCVPPAVELEQDHHSKVVSLSALSSGRSPTTCLRRRGTVERGGGRGMIHRCGAPAGP